MRKIINKSYGCLIYILFALFALNIRVDANEHATLYSIGMLISSIFLAIIPFFNNNCKKIEARRFYLITFILIGVSINLIAISYLLVDIIAVNQTLMNIKNYAIIISQALFISSTLFTIYYGVKDFFKKGYELQKFDFDVIQMIVNLLTYIAFFYVLFDYGNPHVTVSLGGFNGLKDDYYLTFENFNIIRNAILIISGCYILVYVLLEVIKYKKFEKREDTSGNIYK